MINAKLKKAVLIVLLINTAAHLLACIASDDISRILIHASFGLISAIVYLCVDSMKPKEGK